MKAIVVLLALTCFLGVAGAQIIGMGEGYSNTQLAFFNSPTTSTFEPNVQSYWGNYIASQENNSIKSTSSNMDIWMNTFPLRFDTPQLFKASSFAANAAAPTLTATERNSQFLTRNVNSNFGIYQVWSYPVESGSLVISNGTGVPNKDAKGQLLSQNILVLFSS